MKPDPKIQATPRAIRVAYLLEDGPDAHAWLDAIFTSCFGRHGGRQSLVVPVSNGTITARYLDWLQILDPDFILALTYDNHALLSTLSDRLQDTTIIERTRVREHPEENPSAGLHFAGLTAISWMPYLQAAQWFPQATPKRLLDRYPIWADDGIIKDNFGTLYGSVNPFPIHKLIGVRALMLTPANPPQNRWHYGIDEVDESYDAYGVIDQMAVDPGVLTLAHLSNLHSQPYRPDHPWNNEFCLIIGDSFEDRISCWNAGLLFDDAQVQPYKTMRVPSAVRLDAAKIGQIAGFLRRRNWLGQSNGPAKICVRSHSLTAAELGPFLQQLSDAAMSHVRFAPIGTIDECCPPDTSRVYAAYNVGNLHTETSYTTVRDRTTVVPIPEPMHLGYCTGRNPIFSSGSWFVDLSIDRLDDSGPYNNVREKWCLPLRRNLIGSFCNHKDVRLTRHGNISALADMTMDSLEIKQPTDEHVFLALLHNATFFRHPDIRSGAVTHPVYKHSAPSDKGRYLRGMLGMFGSLNSAENVLEKHFWRIQFAKMATPASNQEEEVIQFIKSRMAKDGVLLVNNDETWQQLAKRVIQKSSKLRIPRNTTTFKQLQAEWEKELSTALDSDTHLAAERALYLAYASNELKDRLSYFLDRGVFYRGHEWSCRHCSHRNWVRIDALNNTLQCEVCRESHQLPIDVSFHFRLNEFFATCLREHDTLSVTWALSALRDRTANFLYAPQTVLYRNYPEQQGAKPDRELDVVCIADGKFILGEAKEKVSLIAKSDIEDLATVARELRADVAVLAALHGDASSMDAKIGQLRAILPPSIEARGLISDWGDAPSFSV